MRSLPVGNREALRRGRMMHQLTPRTKERSFVATSEWHANLFVPLWLLNATGVQAGSANIAEPASLATSTRSIYAIRDMCRREGHVALQ